ncbi:sensor histidine kinase [Olsenella intestinalis]|uniref:sensor histidine kinase n=1 Tax=Olsenella intestinalis TaxID=2930083 RepID=UPI002010BFF3
MSRKSPAFPGSAVHVFLAVATVLLLALLSWGLISSNLVAAVLAGAGLAIDIVIAGSSLLIPDDLRSQATERTLRVASGTLSHMVDGLTPESCASVCQLLLPETTASAVAMTNVTETLAFVGTDVSTPSAGAPISAPTREVIASGRMQTFNTLDKDELSIQANDRDDVADLEDETERLYPIGVIVPLRVSDRTVGTIKFYYRHGHEVDRTQLTIARGFAELVSTQLSVYELDRQAELTARAEVKALQAQINPHFLFNTLNTIAALTRTDPARARDVLREFSSFYRRTLESSSQTLIPLSEELEQTRRYLAIEKARFGEERIVETETLEPGCADVMVPGFIVQPIVENAVRHAMRDEGPLHIDVQAVFDGGDVLLAVVDDGNGMDESVAERLLDGSSQSASGAAKGTGIALRNVAERIERFYGVGSGVEIMSKVGEGTSVTLRLVGAAPSDLEDELDVTLR